MTTPRGLVLGYYHRRNAGDDRLMQCLTRLLDGHELTFGPHTRVPDPLCVRRYDYVVLGGGSVANAPAGAFADGAAWVAASCRPVFCFGIGVSGGPEIERAMNAIAASGGLVWVRDPLSAANSGLGERQLIAADPAWLYPFPSSLTNSKELGHTLVNLRPYRGRYEVEPEAWADALRSLPGAQPWPLCFGRDADSDVLETVFPGHPALKTGEFDPAALRGASALVAMRFHAIIFALQTGVPVVAIRNTKKVLQLMASIGLENFVVNNEHPDQLNRLVERAVAEQSRVRLAEITESRRKEAAAAAEHFRAIVDQACEGTAVAANRLRTRVGRRVRHLLERHLP